MSYTGGVIGEQDTTLGRGSRRKKFAGYLRAANELRQSYQASSASDRGDEGFDDDGAGIPGSFPEMKVARSGSEEMVLFPSYARRHVKAEKKPRQPPPPTNPSDNVRPDAEQNDAEFWKREWAIYEDANAIVDVDIRGWIYSPHKGPMNRKNRLMMGIARKLSGIPALGDSQPSSRASSRVRDRHMEEMAEREALDIAQKGEAEAEVAGRGGYTEGRTADSSSSSSRNPSPRPGDLQHPVTSSFKDAEPRANVIRKQGSWSQPAGMSADELTMANRHLLSRLQPFLTNPSVNMSLTVLFYNEKTSQSRTTRTNEVGHFNLRAALDFVPTHVRVLASEDLSASEEVIITEPKGVSLISDIDDTIKHSAIGSGAREIFRNAFVRELGDLTIEGVNKWYHKMTEMGVKLHYVSNSPWQMYPLLVSYFAKAGLPPGSFHLKQYSGMLQGIFEPVAERKRSTLDRILSDFPERRFILVGDSGEADLEVYTETVLMNPGRILGIFIRDVTTSPKQGFFDPSNGNQGTKLPFPSRPNGRDDTAVARPRPHLPPRPVTTAAPLASSASDIGNLIDFGEDFEADPPLRAHTEPLEPPLEKVKSTSSSTRSTPPNLPRKPIALRSKSNEFPTQTPSQALSQVSATRKPAPRPPPKPRELSDSKEFPTQSSSKKGAPPLLPDRAGYRATAMNRLSSVYNSLPAASDYLSHRSHPPPKSSTPSPRAMSTNPSPTPPVPSSTKPQPPKPPPSRTSTSSSSTTASSTPSTLYHNSPHNAPVSSNNNQLLPPPSLPPRRGISSYPAAAAQYASNKWYGTDEPAENGLSKKEELWNRRWVRAKEVCEKKGILLRSWRVGSDALDEAIGLVERAGKRQGEDVVK